MVATKEGVDRSSRRLRIWHFLVLAFLVLAIFFTFLTKSRSVAKTKAEIRLAIEQSDWKRLSELLPRIDLQGGTLPAESFAAFMTHYIKKSEKLVVTEKEYVGQTGIEVHYADGYQSNERGHQDSQILQILVVPDKNKFPFLPPVPRIKYEYTQTWVAVAVHEFRGTERFRPTVRSPIYGPPQFLFAVREKKNFEAIRVPPYWGGSLAPNEWDRFISSLRASLEHDGWDVVTLQKAFKVSDFQAPAKDSRRP